MKSGVWIKPGEDGSKETAALLTLFNRAADLSSHTQKPVEILLQHSLRHDKMAVTVNLPRKTFSGVSENFTEAFLVASKAIEDYINGEDLQPEKKSDAGIKGSKRNRRKSTESKRSDRLRKGGR